MPTTATDGEKCGLAVVLVLRTHLSCWRSRPSRLLLTATAVVSLLAVSLPYAGAVAQAFGFMPLPLPLLIATFLIVLLFVVATEFTKLWFYRWLMRVRVDGARTSAAGHAS